VTCGTNGCERSCSSAGKPPTSSPKPWASTPRPWSGGSPRAARRTVRTGTRWPRSSAWTSPTSGPMPWAATRVAAVSQSEVVAVYPHRWAVPRDTWGHFFSQAERDIGALVYSGMFMAEDIGVHRLFAERARAGVRVRLLLGDPDSRNVAERGEAEGIDEGMAAKVKNSIVLFGGCWPSRTWNCGCTARCCTTRSTAPMTRCWSTPTSTGSWRTTRRCSTCARSRAGR
jgi:hypothetical protein